MNTSTVPTVRAQLVAQLEARAGLTGIQVAKAHPGDSLQAEAIYLGQARGSHEPAAMKSGRMPRDEEYVVDLIIDVVKPDGDPADAEARAFVLLAEVESLLADTPRIGLSPDVVAWVTAGAWETFLGRSQDQGGVAAIRLEVMVRARLS